MKVGPGGWRGSGDFLVLVGEGPHALVAARRAAEIVSASGGALSLTLFNVQEPVAADEDSELTPEERGENVIEELAKRAGIEYMNYTSHVEVVVDVEETILEPTPDYDTGCIGATRTGPVTQAVFGSLPETIGEEADATVVMARGAEQSPMSIREAITRRSEV